MLTCARVEALPPLLALGPVPEPGPPEYHVALRDYDWTVISTSAGVDSQATTDVLYQLAVEADVLDRLVMVHADLGRAEWPGTLELAREHAATYALRFEVVYRVKNGRRQDLLQQIEERGMFPSAKARFCTSDAKRGPIGTLFTRLAAESRAGGITDRPIRILSVLGMRSQESPTRAAMPSFQHEGGLTCVCGQCQALPREARPKGRSNTRKHLDQWLPLKHWSKAQVIDRCRRAPTLMHPAYGLGFPRASCVFCILASRSALVRACQVMPELAATYAALEQRIDHTIQHGFSIAEAIRLAAEADGPVQVQSWNG